MTRCCHRGEQMNAVPYRRSAIESESVSPSLGEKVFAVLVLLFSTKGVIPLLRASPVELQQVRFNAENVPDPLVQVLWTAIYLITSYLLVTRCQPLLPRLLADGLLWLLTALAIASVVWSAAPAMTVQRCLAFTGTTAFGAYLALRFSRTDL
jgi:exopolysaccharide production protein ExoQ